MIRDIKDFEDYQISDLGIVFSKQRTIIRQMSDGRTLHKKLKARVLKPSLTQNGYEFVQLRRHGKSFNKRIHRLVAETFVDGKSDGLVVHHINGDKLDNRAENLEWVSMQRNTQEYYKSIGKSNGSIPISSIPNVIDRISKGEKAYLIAREYGVTRHDITTICKVVSLTGKELTLQH